MIKKIRASNLEKIIFTFIVILAIFFFGSFFLIKDKCLFIESYDPQKINFDNPRNIAILNVTCGNVIIELYPEISPEAVKRFKEDPACSKRAQKGICARIKYIAACILDLSSPFSSSGIAT